LSMAVTRTAYQDSGVNRKTRLTSGAGNLTLTRQGVNSLEFYRSQTGAL
jgi:hypothetical protein